MKHLKAALVAATLLSLPTMGFAKTNDWKMDSLYKQVSISQEAQSLQETDRREFICMALSIYHEARGVPEHGKYSVAHAIKNRTTVKTFAPSICGVVWQSFKGRPQFSWTTKSVKNIIPRYDASWDACQTVAYKVLFDDDDEDDPTHGATHFYNVHVHMPAWARNAPLTFRDGQHIFVRPKGI